MRIRSLAAGALFLAGACTDRLPTDPPLTPPGSTATRAALACTARVDARTLECAPAAGGGISSNLLIGGQNVNVRLSSANMAYDSAQQVFSMDVSVQNLLSQQMGTPDGTTLYGVNVFFTSPPAASQGTGTVEVANPDGFGTFTGSGQEFFHYPEILLPRGTSQAREWRFSLPPTVQSFIFYVYVETRVAAEAGVLRWQMVSGAVATNTSLLAVTGTGPGNVFAAGNMAVVHRDANGWARMTLPTPPAFSALAAWAHAPDRVFLAGADGAVLRYDGNRWTRKTVGSAETLRGVWSAGRDTVLATAWDSPNPGTGLYEGVLFRSADGGDTWTRTVIPYASNRILEGVHGARGGPVYIAGYQRNTLYGRDEALILRSTDGGATWTPFTSRQDHHRRLRDVWSTGDTVFAVGSQTDPVTARSQGVILRSVDGGASWGVTVSAHTLQRQFQSVWAAGPDTVFVVGSQEIASAVHEPVVLRSTDGGATWSLTVPAHGGLTRLQDVWGVSGREAYAVGDRGALLRWDGAAWTPEQMDTGRTLRAVWSGGRDTLLAAGYQLDDDDSSVADGVILASTNGGRSWSTWTRTGGRTQLLGAWGSGATMIAVGLSRPAGATVNTGLVMRSTDAGATWTPLEQPHTTTRTLSAVSGTCGDTVFAVGSQQKPSSTQTEGVILRSTDAGATWTATASTYGGSRSLTGVRGFADGRVVAVGSQLIGAGNWRQGIILRSGDGGATWTLTATTHNESRVLNAVWGPNADTLFAAGYQTSVTTGLPEGVVLRSTDGGASWTAYASPAPGGRMLYGISGLSATEVYAAGSDGALLYWDGTTWRTYPPVTSATLWSVDASAGRTWMAGEFGTVLRGVR